MIRARIVALAWWFFWTVAGGGAGHSGPFETEAGCNKIRDGFFAFFVLGDAQKCTSDRFDR